MKNVFVKCGIILLIALGLILSSCGNEPLPDKSPTALIIIAGNHANSRVSMSGLSDIIKKTYNCFGNISVIISDGSPSVMSDEKGDPIGFCDDDYIAKAKKTYQNNKGYWTDNYFEPLTANVYTAVINGTADDAEVDILKSLQLAEKLLDFLELKMDTSIEKKIVIFDTGLSTAGALNFTDSKCNELLGSQTRIEEDEEQKEKVKLLLDELKYNEEIPALSGVDITWYGLGDVGGDQKELSNLQISNLRYIWNEILNASIDVDDSLSETNDFEKPEFFVNYGPGSLIESKQKVTTVDIDVDEPPTDGDECSDAPPYTITNLPVVPDTYFKDSSSKFRDDMNPIVSLKPLADYINSHADVRYLLVGTTADPHKNGGDIKLSRDRANAVKNVLVNDLGVTSDRIDIVGVGAKSPWYNKNEWQNGKFIPDSEEAKSNRSVRILEIDSSLATEILKEYGN